MKRFLSVVVLLAVLGGAVWAAAAFKIEKTWWSRSSVNRDDEVHSCCVAGVLVNQSDIEFKRVKISFGIYDVNTKARVKTQCDIIADMQPGDRWQFKCEPPVRISATDRRIPYYYKFLKIDSERAPVPRPTQ